MHKGAISSEINTKEFIGKHGVSRASNEPSSAEESDAQKNLMSHCNGSWLFPERLIPLHKRVRLDVNLDVTTPHVRTRDTHVG